jgi:hypothetical protein
MSRTQRPNHEQRIRKHRRPSYAMIQILTLLPLIIVVGAISMKLAALALGAQRVAVVHTTNDDEAQRILRSLREDAASATEARVERDEAGCTLRFEHSDRTISYRAEPGDVACAIVVSDGGAERLRYELRRAAVDFTVEPIGERGSVVWIRSAFTHQWSGDREQTWSLAGAVRVGDGGAS